MVRWTAEPELEPIDSALGDSRPSRLAPALGSHSDHTALDVDMSRDSESDEDAIPVKSEKGSVPRRRSRSELESDSDSDSVEAENPSHASPSASKRARRLTQTSSQPRRNGTQTNGVVDGASAPVALMRDSTGSVVALAGARRLPKRDRTRRAKRTRTGLTARGLCAGM